MSYRKLTSYSTISTTEVCVVGPLFFNLCEHQLFALVVKTNSKNDKDVQESLFQQCFYYNGLFVAISNLLVMIPNSIF